MKSGKAVGPDDIPVEVWKCLGEAAVEFLASLFNRVLENLEKAYDRVPREELWYCMRKSGVAEKYVRVVQDMYERSRTVVRCAVGQTEEFNVEVGLHQGSALSPFLFAIVMDQLSEEVRQESPWTMMFADDIVICSESREQVEENLERWRFALERRGMKVSRSKTEYMCVNEREGSGTVRLQGEEVKKVQEFKYLGSTVQSNGECGKEVKKRVQAGWNGWRKVSGVLCDQKISARIKGKVYRTVVRPAMLYGLETVSLRKRQESELEVAELKMLRFSLGVTRLDRIRNEYIRGTAHVGRLGDKVREARLRWFGHVQRRDSETACSTYPFFLAGDQPAVLPLLIYKTSFYKEKLETSAQDPRKLHNIFSSLLNPPAPPSPSSLTTEDFATFYTEKIERICQNFTSPPTSSTSHNQHSTTPSLMQLSTVAAEEVLQIIWSCNPTTCPLDPIPSAMIQTISPDLLPFITTVINGSLTSGHVPTVFMKARVIPILKKPALDPSDISSYRPVSLLSFLSKILERVCNQLSDYLMQNNLHEPNQSGFKAAHSTETALLAVTEKLHAARSAKLSSVLILLDLSAAFDTINHKTLVHPQESWNLWNSMGMVCFLPGWSLISDTTASARISACLVDISSWMTTHQLKLNPSKTELLVIPGDPSPAQDLAISLNNSMISPSATARNLGVTMDNQLSFSSHVTNVTRSCRFLLYNIRRIRPFLSTRVTQVLVQSLVISRLDYCNSLLAGLPLNATRPLQMLQNAAARLVFNLPKFSHTTPLLHSLHWLLVAAGIRFKTLMLAYKAKNGPAPSYLKALVTPHTASRSLRSTSTAQLVPPSLRVKDGLTIVGLPKLYWRWRDWADLVTPLLTGDAQLAYYALEKEEARDYKQLKRDILAQCGCSPVNAAGDIHRCRYDPGVNPRAQMDDLLHSCRQWLQPDQLLAWEIVERVAMDRFLRALPAEERKAVGLCNPTSPREFLEKLECVLVTLEIGRDIWKDFRPPPRWPQTTWLLELGPLGERKKPEDQPRRGPVDEPMPTEPALPPPARASKPWLTGCALHAAAAPEAPRVTVELNGRSVPALLDSGNTITLIRPTALPRPTKLAGARPVS
ncbi:hypothetical protein QTP70_012207 [Hemibagrus guttatus]|uniref:ribonuclease H n=1 Tax=Hemibagrus guttatus TaxID=175788 RepID=A0AAE0VEF0_9TELE|nr:hypothetical protein QTP70_012207 [Hemibagrus guttatus]